MYTSSDNDNDGYYDNYISGGSLCGTGPGNQQYFTIWYLCTVQNIIPLNRFNCSEFWVPLDWIDFIILRKSFDTPLLECTHIKR